MREEKLQMARETFREVLQTHDTQPGEAWHAAYFKEHREWLCDKMLSLKWPNGAPMFAVLDDEQAFPVRPFELSGEELVGWSKAIVACSDEGWRKTVPKMTFLVYQCWVAPGCKTLSEAINNPRLLRTTPFDNRASAERYLQRCKDKKEERFVYWLEEER